MKSTTFRVHRSAVCVLIFNEVPFCSGKKKRNRRKKYRPLEVMSSETF